MTQEHAWRTALQFSAEHILDRRHLEGLFVVHAFQAGVLALQFFQSLRLKDADPAVLLLPQVERRSTDLVLPQQIGDCGAGLGFA